MIFTELRFLAFFALVFAVHWGLRGARARQVWLLLVSYAFYAAWDWRFLGLILLSTVVDFVAGLRMVRPGAHKRRWLTLSLVVNLGLLGCFKYADFFVGSAAELLGWLGLGVHETSLHLILPVGISFYTFQTLSYTIDVYRGTLRPTRDPLRMALFVAFFPQLVAGPIVRAATFLPQLETPRRFARIDVRAALVLFLVGFFKKACVSDNLAPVVDAYFARPAAFDLLGTWTAVLAYAAQIYCDFSGYSDMAIGCAALLGYRLTLNFDFPYLAAGPAEFWRRWHISLSTWLRDYLYIPLGGNRGTDLATYRNLLVTMLLGGLWHGAAWTFVAWGALHGVALMAQRAWRARRPAPAGPLWRATAVALTFWLVCVAWILFRAEDFSRAATALRAFVLFDADGGRDFGPWVLAALGLLAALHGLAASGRTEPLWRRVPPVGFAFGAGVAFALFLAVMPHNPAPFIYFQF